MKKLLLTTGTIASGVAPLATVVACSDIEYSKQTMESQEVFDFIQDLVDDKDVLSLEGEFNPSDPITNANISNGIKDNKAHTTIEFTLPENVGIKIKKEDGTWTEASRNFKAEAIWNTKDFDKVVINNVDVKSRFTTQYRSIGDVIYGKWGKYENNLNWGNIIDRPSWGTSNRPGFGPGNRPGWGSSNRPNWGWGSSNRPGIGWQPQNPGTPGTPNPNWGYREYTDEQMSEIKTALKAIQFNGQSLINGTFTDDHKIDFVLLKGQGYSNGWRNPNDKQVQFVLPEGITTSIPATDSHIEGVFNGIIKYSPLDSNAIWRLYSNGINYSGQSQQGDVIALINDLYTIFDK